MWDFSSFFFFNVYTCERWDEDWGKSVYQGFSVLYTRLHPNLCVALTFEAFEVWRFLTAVVIMAILNIIIAV